MAFTLVLGFVASERVRESPKPFVRAAIFFGNAMLILLGTIGPLKELSPAINCARRELPLALVESGF
jgi:hypothetical protein